MEELKVPVGSTLSDIEVRVLDFERQWWRFAGAKDLAIKEHFQMSTTRYYALLNCLIDRNDALEAAPLLIARLRRLRDARIARRFTAN